MKKLALLAAAGLFAASCSSDKAAEATTGEAQEIQTTDAMEVNLDEGSQVAWRGFKTFVESEHVGTVDVAKGYFSVEGDAVVGGKIKIDLTTIVNTDVEDPEWNAKLVGHLQSEDFFFTEQYPYATFEIASITPMEGEGVNSKVVGNLEMRGVTNSIEFPANITVENGSVTFDAPTFSIDRTKWGVKFHDRDDASIASSLQEDLIDHSIELTISVTASK